MGRMAILVGLLTAALLGTARGQGQEEEICYQCADCPAAPRLCCNTASFDSVDRCYAELCRPLNCGQVIVNVGLCSTSDCDTIVDIALGERCVTAAGCASGFCIDGVCCNTACAGLQEQCNLEGQAGTCTSVAAPAPTLSARAILLALVVLTGLGGFALQRRA